MRPETTYNNSGKSSYANFEIGPDLMFKLLNNKLKCTMMIYTKILVKLHIKFIRFGATA